MDAVVDPHPRHTRIEEVVSSQGEDPLLILAGPLSTTSEVV